MDIWVHANYRAALRSYVNEIRGNLTSLANAAKCQPSYLLRIINENSHLTPDQAFRVCGHMRLSGKEQEYFLILVEHARAADAEFKRHLQAKLDHLLEEHNNLKDLVKRDSVDDSQTLLEYHRDWRISFLHFLTACRDFRSLESLARRLHLGFEELNQLLMPLVAHGLIELKGNFCRYRSGTGHIPAGSPVLPVFLTNWRLLAAQRSAFKSEKAVFYSNLQTIGRDDVQKLIALAKQFIQKSKILCDDSASEDVIAVNLDVFVP